MNLDHGHYIVSPDDLHEKLEQVQLSSHLSDEEEELLPCPYLPPKLNLASALCNQDQRPRRAHYGFTVSKDILLDYALRWYQGKFTRENLKRVDPFLVGTICVGAAKKHLEIDPAHPRLHLPLVETPDGLKPCVAIYDSYEMHRWNLDAAQETELIEFIRSELNLPETQEPMWYYSNCR